MPTITSQQRRQNIALDAASAASCSESLSSLLCKAGGIDSADPEQVRALIRTAEAALCRIRRNFDRAQAEGAIPVAEQVVRLTGPNLRDQSQGTFRVTVPSCACENKLARTEPAEFRNAWTIAAESLLGVADAVYGEDAGDFDGDASDYVSEFHFCKHVNLPAA